MYNNFYNLKETPFNLTPNSRFFFKSDKHTEALDSLVYAINQRKGFVVITGEIGSGKTTVCRTLLNKLDKHTQVALVTNTHLSSKDLLMTIMEDLEIEFQAGSKARMLSQLNTYLIEQLQKDNNVVLIIDEAQNLKPSVLEEIRMLSNLETETEKLIQIILLGQPELKQKLSLARLEQLRQRVSVYFHLSPLSKQETKEYVVHRLRIASESNREYMTNQALDLIYEFSKGVPRLINQICDSAFLTGYVKEAQIIDEHILQEVITESPVQQFIQDKEKEYA
ncbi:MAG: AAA family ATPase [Candidatus Omnitrophica bacterium]|nr:AAA family ATPase [Candidatus Omnitrophota bacterium]